MMQQVIKETGFNASDDDINKIIIRLLNNDFYDHSGLIYGFGHAVYTLSDPRCEILKKQAYSLAISKNRKDEFEFYLRFEKLVKAYFSTNKHRNICANIDFYSGLVYDMMNIPEDLFSPLFVLSRSIGWLAHNIEDKLYCNRIIRPAGKFIKGE